MSEGTPGRELYPVVVCPVTGHQPPPEPLDAFYTRDKVMRCWICDQPLTLIHVGPDDERRHMPPLPDEFLPLKGS